MEAAPFYFSQSDRLTERVVERRAALRLSPNHVRDFWGMPTPVLPRQPPSPEMWLLGCD